MRWRVVDLCQWVFEEFRVVVAKQTLSRQLRAMGYRKLSARPRHNRGVVKAPAVDDKIDRLLSAMGSPATPLAYELDGLKRRLCVLPTSGAVG